MNFVKASANDGIQLTIFVNSGQCMSHHFGSCSKIPPVKYTICEETMTLKYIFKY